MCIYIFCFQYLWRNNATESMMKSGKGRVGVEENYRSLPPFFCTTVSPPMLMAPGKQASGPMVALNAVGPCKTLLEVVHDLSETDLS